MLAPERIVFEDFDLAVENDIEVEVAIPAMDENLPFCQLELLSERADELELLIRGRGKVASRR